MLQYNYNPFAGVMTDEYYYRHPRLRLCVRNPRVTDGPRRRGLWEL